MQPYIEKEATFYNMSVQLATIRWDSVQERPFPNPGHYFLCQRLSDNHSPLRIGNLNVPEAFARVRSVGMLPPDCAIQLFPLKDPFRVLNCAFDKEFFEDTTKITAEQWDDHTEALVSIKNRRLEILMQEIYAELVQPDFGRDLMIEAASTMILVELGRYIRQLARKSSKYGSSSLALAPWQLRRIQKRIQSSLELGYPNLSELAELCNVSQSHLMRGYKVSTGWQIHKYIAHERLNTAKSMLVQDQLSCKEVADRLGFCSSAYFATVFRRMTGRTPREFQRQTRETEVSNSL